MVYFVVVVAVARRSWCCVRVASRRPRNHVAKPTNLHLENACLSPRHSTTNANLISSRKQQFLTDARHAVAASVGAFRFIRFHVTGTRLQLHGSFIRRSYRVKHDRLIPQVPRHAFQCHPVRIPFPFPSTAYELLVT